MLAPRLHYVPFNTDRDQNNGGVEKNMANGIKWRVFPLKMPRQCSPTIRSFPSERKVRKTQYQLCDAFIMQMQNSYKEECTVGDVKRQKFTASYAQPLQITSQIRRFYALV